MITNRNQQHTEVIRDIVNTPYVGKSEATWRIFGFEISGELQAVPCLTVHLPGENFHQMPRKNSTGSIGFKLQRNFASPTAPQFVLLKHTKFYRKYIHKPFADASYSNLNQWLEPPSPDINISQIISSRVGGDIVSRLTLISPCKGEVFYLRALLLHKAANNDEQFHPINNITYDTIEETTTQLDLFPNNDEVENCLQDAIAVYCMPYHVGFLYMQLIVDIPAPALELWEKYKDELSADRTERFATADQAYLEALRDIKRLLTPRGSNLSDFGLSDPGQRINELDIE
jgi:hypothetical protein